MVIVEREGKYFLQISNGELELSEKQAKARLEKGTAVLKNSSYVPEGNIAAFAGHDEPDDTEHQTAYTPQGDTTAFAGQDEPAMVEHEADQAKTNISDLSENEASEEIRAQAGPQTNTIWENEEPAEAAHEEATKTAPKKRPVTPLTKIPTEARAFILSDEYYDNIIREFEKVYVANDRKEGTALELLDHCQRSIDHLKLERSQPGADLALLDYQRICWLRIVVFLQALTGVPAPKHPDSIAAEKEKTNSERELVKQLLVIQLLQETGAFPYADALKSITHDSIVGLVSRILNKDKNIIKTAMQRSGDILLRRNVSPTNAPKRLKMLIDIETYFSELPYNHVIIRLRSLKEFYKNYHDKTL